MAEVTIYYDHDCGFCTNMVRRYVSRSEGKIEAKPKKGADWISETRFQTGFVVVDNEGKEFWGADGVFKIAPLARLGWLSNPLIRPFVRLGYPIIARNRHRISKLMGWNSCELPPKP